MLTSPFDCICNPVHVSGCPAETHPSLMFTRLQKCACSQGRSPLCVFHALMHVVLDLRLRQQFVPEKFLFGNEGPQQFARSVRWPRRRRSSCRNSGPAQHSFRVAGAQMFARTNIPLPTIQVIGRWGSAAIMRYVQNSVFVPEQAALTVQAAWSSSATPSSSGGFGRGLAHSPQSCVATPGRFHPQPAQQVRSQTVTFGAHPGE